MIKVEKIAAELERGEPVEVYFSPIVTGHKSGKTYLIGGIVNNGTVLIKRLEDERIGGVAIPVEELLEV